MDEHQDGGALFGGEEDVEGTLATPHRGMAPGERHAGTGRQGRDPERWVSVGRMVGIDDGSPSDFPFFDGSSFVSVQFSCLYR